MVSPGLGPETFSVLDWRDKQLHHDTIYATKPKLYKHNKTAISMAGRILGRLTWANLCDAHHMHGQATPTQPKLS